MSMLKKTTFVFLVVSVLPILGFVIKEVFFFNPNNPYGAKEISQDELNRIKKEIGEQYPKALSPEEFAESMMSGKPSGIKGRPFSDETALELATSRFEAYCDEQSIDSLNFKIPIQRSDHNYLWIFDFHGKNSSIKGIRVTIDKYGRISLVQIPSS